MDKNKRIAEYTKADLAKALYEMLPNKRSITYNVLAVTIKRRYNQTVEEFKLDNPEYFI